MAVLMNPTLHCETVLEILEGLGVEIRAEAIEDGCSGYCEVQGKRIVFIDKKCGDSQRLDVCLDALSRLEEIESLFLPPAVREAVERIRRPR